MTSKPLSEAGAAFFTERAIDLETVVRLGIFTVERDARTNAMEPSANGNVIAFPYSEHGVDVARKYRGPGKKFWQEPGGRRTFWNSDALDSEALNSGTQALVITEGEIDALSAIEAGFVTAVSVPDGAPAPPTGNEQMPKTLDMQDEQTGKFAFLFNNRDRLKRIKRFIIAVDSDAPGRHLAEELVRRLGAARCAFITYPTAAIIPLEGGGRRACKDLNEVLVYLGPERVVQILNAAKPYPVRGLYRLSDYPERSEIKTYPVGFEGWGRYLRLFTGELLIITGVPGHGKSSFTTNLLFNMAAVHQWSSAIFSPEMPASPVLRDRFRRLYLRKRPLREDVEEKAKADNWINRYMVFIDADPTGAGDSDEAFDLDWVLERAADAVLRDGVRIVLIDPWNEVEHARQPGESAADYIGRALRSIKRFAKLYDVVAIVVAHPTKEVNTRDGKPRLPNLYDIDGAAHWFNKADHELVVHRVGNGQSAVHIQKVRFDETGSKQKMLLAFDRETGLFEPSGNEEP